MTNFLRDLFSDLVDVIIRNLSLSPDDVARLQEIEQTFRDIGNKLADNVRVQVEDALENIRRAYDDTFDSVEKRLHDVEEKVDSLLDQQSTKATPKASAKTKESSS